MTTIFNLTVSAEGQVSLWDTEEQADRAAEAEGEVSVGMDLTYHQVDLLDLAQQSAFAGRVRRGR